jgi:hypothetical protein
MRPSGTSKVIRTPGGGAESFSNQGEYRSATLKPAYIPIPVPTMLIMKAVMNPIPEPADQPSDPPIVEPIITQIFFSMTRKD